MKLQLNLKKKTYFKNNNTKGITLIALIITVVILLILAAVAINAVQGDGIIGYAKDAKTEYIVAEEKEQIALALEEWEIAKQESGAPTFEAFLKGKFGDENVTENDDNWKVKFANTGNEYDVEGEHTLKIGDFVKYNVSYTDVYINKEYTADNGWRYLGTDESGNNLIISTGIPAMLYYSYYNSTNNTWWVKEDATEGEETTSRKATLEEFKKLLNGNNNDDYTFYNGNNSDYKSLQTSAGLYYNFGDINFYATSSSSVLYNFYTSITSNDRTYNNTNNGTEVTANDLFNLHKENEGAKVRLLTLPEVNKAVGRNDIDSTDTISEDEDKRSGAVGLYRLDQLKNISGMNDYNYSNTGCYWLASPYPGISIDNKVCRVDYNGSISGSSGTSYGVRPIVVLPSDIPLERGNQIEIVAK